MSGVTLESLDAKLNDVLALLRASAPKPVAAASDLDGKYGNPVIKARDPRDWTGESMVGRLMSDCPAEYLDMVAERAEFFAGKNDEAQALANNGQPKSKYDRLDAARARGWAARIRSGWKSDDTTSTATPTIHALAVEDDDGVPF